MKRTLCLLLTLLAVLSLFAGCSGSAPSNEKLSVVVTSHPAADWLWHLLGTQAENWDLTILPDNGSDLHSYQATAEDMVAIASCDLLVCVGGVSDTWVDDALKNVGNPERRVVRLLDALGSAARTEELVEGMEAEEEEAPELDEHIWLSLKNAATLCDTLAQTLAEIDPANAAVYAANAEEYIGALHALDLEYDKALQNAAHDTVIVADRFPFRYLMDDYGLHYYAAFAGCSADAEASFETVVFLANKLDELGLGYVLQTESSDGALAQTVIAAAQTSNAACLTLDSMQSGEVAEQADGAAPFAKSYLEIMQENLAVLCRALGD